VLSGIPGCMSSPAIVSSSVMLSSPMFKLVSSLSILLSSPMSILLSSIWSPVVQVVAGCLVG
jgi:hypothetical protein